MSRRKLQAGAARAPKHPPTRTGSAPAWYWGAWLAVLFAFALAWRLAYLQRLDASVLEGVLQGDERDYWGWATYLLHHGFAGHNPFFQGPLYPYLLAGVRALTGHELLPVLRVQAVLGALAVAVLADAARRLTRPSVALALGVVLALFETSVLFDGLVLSESLLFLLEAFLLWLWCRAARTPSAGLFAASALVAGLAAQCRATGLLLLVPTLWLAWRAGAPDVRAARARAALVAGVFALTLLPSLAWNWSRTHEWIPYTYNLGFNLYVGNNPNANGSFVSVTGGNRPATIPQDASDGGADGDGREYLRTRRGLDLSPAASSRWWAREAFAYARAQPGHALWLAGRKTLLMWNRRETPQLEDAALFRRLAGPLGLPGLGTFAFVGTLGLVGLALAGGLGAMGAALRLYVLAVMAGMLPFFTTDRYRHHLVPALALLAAFAAHEALRRARARGPAGLRALALLGAGAAVFVALPVRERDAREDAWRAARDLGTRWLDHGQPGRAALEFEHALALQHALGLDRDPDESITSTRALLDYQYGVALHRLGRDDESVRWLRRAAEEEPLNSTYTRTLADAYLVGGREREGDSLLQRLGAMVGGEGERWISLGWQAARAGRLDSAEVCFRHAIAADERLFGGWTALVRVQVQSGEFDAARASLASAAERHLPAPALLAHEALLAAATGDRAAAEAALARIPPEALAGDRLLAGVVATARGYLARPR